MQSTRVPVALDHYRGLGLFVWFPGFDFNSFGTSLEVSSEAELELSPSSIPCEWK